MSSSDSYTVATRLPDQKQCFKTDGKRTFVKSAFQQTAEFQNELHKQRALHKPVLLTNAHTASSYKLTQMKLDHQSQDIHQKEKNQAPNYLDNIDDYTKSKQQPKINSTLSDCSHVTTNCAFVEWLKNMTTTESKIWKNCYHTKPNAATISQSNPQVYSIAYITALHLKNILHHYE